MEGKEGVAIAGGEVLQSGVDVEPRAAVLARVLACCGLERRARQWEKPERPGMKEQEGRERARKERAGAHPLHVPAG